MRINDYMGRLGMNYPCVDVYSLKDESFQPVIDNSTQNHPIRLSTETWSAH